MTLLPMVEYAIAMTGQPEDPSQRNADQLARELQETRERLSRTVNDLSDYVRPRSIFARGLGKMTEFFTDEQGSPRPERIAGVVASVVGFLRLAQRRHGKDD